MIQRSNPAALGFLLLYSLSDWFSSNFISLSLGSPRNENNGENSTSQRRNYDLVCHIYWQPQLLRCLSFVLCLGVCVLHCKMYVLFSRLFLAPFTCCPLFAHKTTKLLLLPYPSQLNTDLLPGQQGGRQAYTKLAGWLAVGLEAGWIETGWLDFAVNWLDAQNSLCACVRASACTFVSTHVRTYVSLSQSCGRRPSSSYKRQQCCWTVPAFSTSHYYFTPKLFLLS